MGLTEQIELIKKHIPSFYYKTENYDREYYYMVYVDNVLVTTCSGLDLVAYISGMVDEILFLKK